MARNHGDRILLGLTAILVFVGFFIFSSASLGLVARTGASFAPVAIKQILYGVVLGGILLVIGSKINFNVWKKYAFYFLIGSFLLTAVVFIPGLGFTHGGATRWIDLGIFSFQPAEVLKLGIVIYLAALFSSIRGKVETIKYGILPMMLILALTGTLLLLQPDMGTFVVILAAVIGMFIAAGGKLVHATGIIVILAIGLIALSVVRPYANERILTFLDPGRDPLGAGYQIKQSLIAVGSGQLHGRGFGQSIQKFEFLPEPTGDSIFAVFAEEFGFIGSIVLLGLFLAFALRGLFIASSAPTRFSGLLTLGIVILIIFQSLINIASMIGVFPLTGVPLLFVSQGGSALMMALFEVGILLNISKYV